MKRDLSPFLIIPRQNSASRSGCHLPPLTLIDQPFAALDAPSVRFLTELLHEAASHPSRAWVIADYEAPAGITLARVIDL